ncbi:beta-hexosaminidase 3-like [Beta vulgaris subsp. vulgaris]|uniref:beta-hexosaminidase 3-like n=1 Tax=Beta vulgaris subsp. vulgaris TaxID=3555 RepID=UPI0025477F3F|nr:beta-hexosaminidase 3-like [Beta vulgaris subsp. vulgaris]
MKSSLIVSIMTKLRKFEYYVFYIKKLVLISSVCWFAGRLGFYISLEFFMMGKSRTQVLFQHLYYEVDESYNLTVPAAGKPAYAHIEANSVYGALHGLQTLSQLCGYNFKTRLIEINMVPWTVFDQPRFPYHGLLIDTSRHYIPLSVIKKAIDSMTYAKLVRTALLNSGIGVHTS